MRKLKLLFRAIAILTFASAPSALSQTCCHTSRRYTDQPTASPAAPLSPLTAADLRRQFNACSQKVRIVALLSPTCAECQSGHAVVGRILKKFSSSQLQALLVWEPMRDADSPSTAAEQAGMVQDARISQGWDAVRDVGKLFGATLDLHEIAWDVYLVYKPGITWESEQPPQPTFWMHQLDGEDPNRLLCANPSRLGEEVRKLLGQSD